MEPTTCIVAPCFIPTELLEDIFSLLKIEELEKCRLISKRWEKPATIHSVLRIKRENICLKKQIVDIKSRVVGHLSGVQQSGKVF